MTLAETPRSQRDLLFFAVFHESKAETRAAGLQKEFELFTTSPKLTNTQMLLFLNGLKRHSAHIWKTVLLGSVARYYKN